MGKDRKQKQQKKAQKAAKKRAKKSENTKQMTRRGVGVPVSMRQALQAPVYECWEPKELFQRNCGIGHVLISRKTSQHQVLIGTFLVDVFCLGVKDAFIRLVSEQEYKMFLQQAKSHQRLRAVTPERARKLIESAEAYARELGLAPHKDYQAAKKIFDEIDADACPDTFEFGQNGKPLYVAGPYDNQNFQQRILNTLAAKLGPDGFDYVLPMGVPPAELFE